MTDDEGDIRRWDGYIDAIEGDEAEIVLREADAENDEREIAIVPLRLLAHLDPKPGLFVTMRITRDERLVFETMPVTAEHMVESERLTTELLDLLRRVREDGD